MITIEEKLNIFSKLVFEGERKKAQEKIEKMQMHNDEIAKKHLDNTNKKAEGIVQKRILEANNKKKQIIARANIEVKKSILTKKREFLSRLERELEEMANMFIETNEYEIFLLDSLVKILLTIKEKENNSIYITKRDINKFEDKIMDKLKGLEIHGNKVILENLDDSEIGGLMLINHDKGIRLNLTIKEILEEKRDLMGQMVYSSLEEVGD